MLVIWCKDKFERIFDELFLVDEHKYAHEQAGWLLDQVIKENHMLTW